MTRMWGNSSFRFAVNLVASGIVGLTCAQALADGLPATYIVRSIGTLPGGGISRAFGINDLGAAVGRATDTSNGYNDRAVLYDQGALTNLGVLDVPFPLSSEALAINNAGQIVGDTSNGAPHAFLFDANEMKDLESLDNTYGSEARAINATGQIVGSVTIMINPNMAATHAFVSDGVAMTDLTQALGNPDYSEAYGINDAGQIVGLRRVNELDVHAFMLDGGQLNDLGTLGGNNSIALAINSAAQVAGYSYMPDNSAHPFFYANGQMIDIGLIPDATNGVANALNAGGVVVGTMRLPGYGGNTRAFAYANGQLRNINDLLPPNTGWLLQAANSINETGQIAGFGTYNGEILGVVLSPESFGDMNCDGTANFDDINAFVLAITSHASYDQAYPNCEWRLADCNGDGEVNFDDINPFVALLSGT